MVNNKINNLPSGRRSKASALHTTIAPQLTIMSFFSNYKPSTEVVGSVSTPRDDSTDSTKLGGVSRTGDNVIQPAHGHEDFNFVGDLPNLDLSNISVAADAFEQLNPDFMRLLDDLESEVCDPYHNFSQFTLPPVTGPVNNDDDTNFEPKAKKAKLESSSSKTTLVETSQPDKKNISFSEHPSEISTAESKNEKIQVEESKDGLRGEEDSILKRLLQTHESIPTLPSSISEMDKKCLKSDKGKVEKSTVKRSITKKRAVKKSVVKSKPASANNAIEQTECSNAVLLGAGNSDSDTDLSAFSQVQERDMVSGFFKYCDDLKREHAANLAAIEGDAELKTTAMSMIERGQKLLSDIEKRRIASEKTARKMREIGIMFKS